MKTERIISFIQDGTDTCSGLAPRTGVFAQAKRRGAAHWHRGRSPFPDTPELAPGWFMLHVAGLILLTFGTVVLFEAGGNMFPDPRQIVGTTPTSPAFFGMGVACFAAGCDCLRRAVKMQED